MAGLGSKSEPRSWYRVHATAGGSFDYATRAQYFIKSFYCFDLLFIYLFICKYNLRWSFDGQVSVF